jgi:hypothetical protein
VPDHDYHDDHLDNDGNSDHDLNIGGTNYNDTGADHNDDNSGSHDHVHHHVADHHNSDAYYHDIVPNNHNNDTGADHHGAFLRKHRRCLYDRRRVLRWHLCHLDLSQHVLPG